MVGYAFPTPAQRLHYQNTLTVPTRHLLLPIAMCQEGIPCHHVAKKPNTHEIPSK